MERVAVILAGGGGTRFWPLSRQTKPKQFLNFSGNDIMLNDTIKRYEGIIPLDNTIIVANKNQYDLLNDTLLDIVPRINIIKEPMGKNTAACVLYAALVIKKRMDDALMAVMPSDHYFTDIEAYRGLLQKALKVAEYGEDLVTIGIKPTFPSTGYGYIKYNKIIPENVCEAYEVEEFVEKPSFDKAKSYIESGNYLWNSGMFMWKASVIIESYKRFLPRLYDKMNEGYEYIDTEKESQVMTEIYSRIQNISIDYGILERSNCVLVLPGDYGWNDVGSWDALGAIFDHDEHGNIIKAKNASISTRNSIIYSKDRLIATIGIDGLIIADTGDAVLICAKDKAQEVKDMVQLLNNSGMVQYI